MNRESLNIRYGFDDFDLAIAVEQAKDYAFSKGMAMRTTNLSYDARVPVPFCLFPSPFPMKWFQKVVHLQPYINLLLFKVSNSKEFLKECLSSSLEVDEFVQNIFKVYEAVAEDQDNQITLGLIRSDYLLNYDSNKGITGIKQVENNTIASSFGGLAPSVKELHEYILTRLGDNDYTSKLPANDSVSALAQALIAAYNLYANSNAVFLFVVEDISMNIGDQRALEYSISKQENKIKILRCSFKELRQSAVLKERKLFVKDKEVAVVYYRVGYVPEQYEPQDWETRLLIERSSAIKCPTAGLHLAGTKTVQMHLSRPGVLEKFVDQNIAEELRQVYVGQYPLDMGPEGDTALSMGIRNPELYVLKPEREGGGSNFYGDDVKKHLQKIECSDERKAYILMERINPPVISNYVIRRDQNPELGGVTCELGIYGTLLGNKDGIRVNNTAGHVLRSKEVEANECGIVAGFGALDSPFLE